MGDCRDLSYFVIKNTLTGEFENKRGGTSPNLYTKKGAATASLRAYPDYYLRGITRARWQEWINNETKDAKKAYTEERNNRIFSGPAAPDYHAAVVRATKQLKEMFPIIFEIVEIELTVI